MATTAGNDQNHCLNDPAELDRFLSAYAPTAVPAGEWVAFAPDAIALVRRAGPLTRARVEKDIQVLGAVAARLAARGRPRGLDEALTEHSLLDFDLALARAGASDKTRENRRGILRRLQAVHHGVPWRRGRRPDGQRVNDLAPPSLARAIADLVDLAERDGGEDAGALLALVDAARRGPRAAPVPAGEWARARQFAARHGQPLTRRALAAGVTHEVLVRDEPLAVLAAAFQLSRRDLDLGLAHTAALPPALSDEQRAALRGA